MNDAWNSARAALAVGDREEALRIAREYASANPGDARALRMFATIATEIDASESEDAWRRVLALDGDDAEAHYMLGNVEGDRGNFSAAAEHFRRALVRVPGHPQLRASLGLALEQLDDFAHAEACYRDALAAFPNAPATLRISLARVLFRQRRYGEAVTYFDALAARSGIGDASVDAMYAVCLAASGRDDDADAAYRRAIDRGAPADVGRDYAAFLMRHARYDDAARLLQHLASDSNLLSTSMLLMCRMQLADWQDFDALRSRIVERVREGLSGRDDIVPAYDFLSICDDPDLQRIVAARWAREATSTTAMRTRTIVRHRAKLRLGFVSSDYNNHPVARLVVGLLERIDRQRFELFAYSTTANDADSFGERIAQTVDHYRRIDRYDDEGSIRTVVADEIDVLFDLNGYSGTEAIRLFAQRPGAVQMNFLGYTGTLGSPAYDFVVTDRFCVPVEQQPAFSERLLYIEPCYMPSDPRRTHDAFSFTRAEYGLPSNAFVFGAFGAIYKITPAIFDCWMRLLRDADDSVLWLRHLPDDRLRRLRQEAMRRGIDAERLIGAPGERIDRYLARLRLADLFVDTAPFGSHTTVNDALFAGLPVVTMAGNTFAARASASQLDAVGLSDLVARGVDDYVAIARSLAVDRDKLARINERLAHARLDAPLFDMDAYARSFEEQVLRACSVNEP